MACSRVCNVWKLAAAFLLASLVVLGRVVTINACMDDEEAEEIDLDKEEYAKDENPGSADNLESLMWRRLLETWQTQPPPRKDDDRPLLKIQEETLAEDSNATNTLPTQTSQGALPHTLKLCIHQEKCTKTTMYCPDCTPKFNVTRKIDLLPYFANGSWATAELYQLLLNYTFETAQHFRVIPSACPYADASFCNNYRRYEERKHYADGSESSKFIFLYYQDLTDHELVQVGSEAELKLALLRNSESSVKIMACVGW
ncbi:hypothetical protein MPSEU_001105200 [Mayamaea pseudoterrestris]|nr:hypothetical protein MPSEU_001105200 [Mayamaea pseudoterrestris]